MRKSIRNLALALCAVLTLTGCGRAEKKALSDCHKNTKDIMVALMKYSNNHEGNLPSDLQELTKEGLLASEKLVCPGAEKGASCTYELLRPGANLEKLAPSTQVICCRSHKGKTVLGLADGSSSEKDSDPESAMNENSPKAVVGKWAGAVLANNVSEADSYTSKSVLEEMAKKKVSMNGKIADAFRAVDTIPANAKLKPGERSSIDLTRAIKEAFKKLGEGTETIEGDNATVYNDGVCVYLVKEDGKWKVTKMNADELAMELLKKAKKKLADAKKQERIELMRSEIWSAKLELDMDLNNITDKKSPALKILEIERVSSRDDREWAAFCKKMKSIDEAALKSCSVSQRNKLNEVLKLIQEYEKLLAE